MLFSVGLALVAEARDALLPDGFETIVHANDDTVVPPALSVPVAAGITTDLVEATSACATTMSDPTLAIGVAMPFSPYGGKLLSSY
jgi:hypothetical protein